MERECEICGTRFTTRSRLRKYCDDCQQHTDRNRREVRRGVRHIAALTGGPRVHEATCAQCGKVFKTVATCHISFDADDGHHLFCSNKCRDTYIGLHGRCAHCGKLFTGDYLPVLGGKNYGYYCSQRCYDELCERQRLAAQITCTCAHCGKRFRRTRPQTFCSTTCYKAAVAEGWRTKQAEKRRRELEVTIRGRCVVCGKRVEARTKPQLADGYTFLCSDACRRRYAEDRQAQHRARVKSAKAQAERTALEQTGFALCGTCKVRYADCSFMRTNFVNLPPGAHMSPEGKVVRCPRYRGPCVQNE